jgi:Protein of unknown function (DUF3047)
MPARNGEPGRTNTMQARAFTSAPTFVLAVIALSAGLLGALPALAADDAALTPFSTSPAGAAPAAWKFATLPNKTPTAYSIVDLDGARVLKVEANDSYGNLAHTVHAIATDHSTLAWKWRVDTLVADADLKTKAGDDAAAKLCVFFAFDGSKLSFGERTRLALAHTATGQDVPTETLCYVWDNKLPVDTGLTNAFTKRIRMIVLESGPAKLGQWVTQKRNLATDYQRMFSDESEGKIPDVIGIAVSADADNTHQKGLAYFGDITLAP